MESKIIKYYILLLSLILSSIKVKAYDFEVDGLCYNIISDNQVEITYRAYQDGSYFGNLKIPETINYNDIIYHVSSIGKCAFYNCSGLIGQLVIPNTITSIGELAFSNCSGLSGPITIPNSVIRIGNMAFNNCSGLTGSLIIPNSVTSIGTGTFQSCSGFTGDLIIPNSVTSIGSCAFGGCSGFTGSLTIPSSVISIGEYAFGGCSGLTGDLTIPNTITIIENSTFAGCSGFTGSLSIPNSVTIIGENAFYECSGFRGTLTIPNSVKTIEGNAFWCSSNFAYISVEKGNTFYDSRDNCNALIETNSNTLIAGCPSSVIPKSVVKIGDFAFSNSSLTSIDIPEGVTSIGNSAFYNCQSLISVTLPNSITSIGTNVFYSSQKIENVYSNIETPFSIDYFTFCYISSKAVLHIPKGTKIAYTQYDNWICHFTKILEEGEEDVKNYKLSIKATGNGSASYDGNTIKSKTSSFTVNEGTKATISFTPDDGYRIKSVKVDSKDVTSKVSNYQYTITVNSDMSVEVEFEAIPATIYTLSIKATGNGSATYGGENIRNNTKSYTLNSGTSVSATFTPDNGYRIKDVEVNGGSVILSSNNSYTMTINSNTTIEVVFEEIPDTPTTYKLTISSSGNGVAMYNGENIRQTSKNYTLDEDTYVTITFTPDEGYQIENVKVNGSNIGTESSYSTKINANTTVEVVFEAIPVTTYTLTVTASGNGIATFNGTEVRDGSQNFTVNEGSDAIISFTPDTGFMVEEVKVDGNEVEFSESYTISDIISDKTLEVAFAELDRNFSIDGASYHIESFDDYTVTLTEVQKTMVVEVADKIDFGAQEWNIIGISENALDNCDDIAAIVWNLDIPFTAKVTNPNLLLYVKDETYAPAGIRNVVVNGFAKTITLTDAQSGNIFYCPSTFTTQSIIYTHNYSMKTGLNESKGWETIALPFDVQQISHSGKGEIVPFAKWNADNDTKPFWLYELKGTGFVEAEELKANTPYIISMPNNDLYLNEYQLSGRVTFSALNAEVKKSDNIQTASFGNNTFVPTFTSHNAESGYYALNVNNDFETYQGSANVGSKFILNLRRIHPFEAYMTSTSGTRSIDIFDSMTTEIRDVLDITDSQKTQKVYDLSGRLITIGTSLESIRQELPAGVYIINNKKMIIK